jgi:hypothetical protein
MTNAIACIHRLPQRDAEGRSFPAFSDQVSGGNGTLNVGSTAFANTAPSGFTACG